LKAGDLRAMKINLRAACGVAQSDLGQSTVAFAELNALGAKLLLKFVVHKRDCLARRRVAQDDDARSLHLPDMNERLRLQGLQRRRISGIKSATSANRFDLAYSTITASGRLAC
jgi:hypothetical protein